MRRYIKDMFTGKYKWVESDGGRKVYSGKKSDNRDANAKTIHIIPDIEPYESMVDGSRITSRSHHREHLRDHGYEEVGNERMPEREAPKMEDAGPDIAQVMREKGMIG